MKTYEPKSTSDKNLFRLIDRNGDWTHYYHKPSNKYLRSVNYILDMGYPKGVGLIQWLKSKTAEEAERLLRSAGDRGDAIHQLISLIFAGEAKDRSSQVLSEDNKTLRFLTNSEWDAILAFQEFWNDHDPILIVSEMSVYNLKVGYAGTLDAVLMLTKQCENKLCKCKDYINKIGVWDWKSGGGIYNSYGPQIAAYGVSDNLKKLLGKNRPTYTAIARIGTSHKRGYELKFYDKNETNTHYKEFLAAKQNADADYRPFDPNKEIYEIPETLNLVIKRVDAKPKKNAIHNKVYKKRTIRESIRPNTKT